MVIVKSEFALALNQIATERGISPEEVLASIEAAIVAAYKKDYPEKKKADIKAVVDRNTGETHLYEGGKDITPPGFGRIAAQTAKQVIIQKIREAEKRTVASYYKSHLGTIIRGRVIRFDGHNYYLDIGKTEAVLPKDQQVKNEKHQINDRLTVLIKQITDDKFGNPRIIVSRTDTQLVAELFKREVPEIANGAVEIKRIVREPGERTKVAVYSNFKGVDPVGACVGQKGIRVQTVNNEIGTEEKIDIIPWSNDPKILITNSLSPAKVKEVIIDEKTKKAKVIVEDQEVPLAIGRGGVNVGLASELTGYEIEIEKIDTVESTDSSKENNPS